MSMFAKRVVGPVNGIFKKSASTVGNIFKKGGAVETGVDRVSHTLGSVSRGLSNINREAGKVLNSDIAKNLAHMAGPNGMSAYQGAVGANKAIGLSSNLAAQGSAMANRGNYRGNSGDVATNLLERGKKIANTGAEGRGIKFT